MQPVLHLKHNFGPLFYHLSNAFNSLSRIQSVMNCLTLLVDTGASVTLNMKGAVKKVKPVCFALQKASLTTCGR